VKRIHLRVRRQDDPEAPRRWESFAIDRGDHATIADLLHAINRDPRTAQGERVAPIAWASSCAFPICGGCAMQINGRAALACKTRIDDAASRRGLVSLAPLDKFPLERDLWVDLGRMRRDRLRLRAWHAPIEVAAESAPSRALRLALERCTSCGACLEACPEVRRGAPFVGPAAIAASRAADLASPEGREPRLEALMQPGGIDDCGRAENCIHVCPEAVPLGDALAASSRDVTRRWLRGLVDRFRGSRS
jgi:succinate dehydrogenase / fumarate reductase iron-sulfur subunit